MFDVHIFEQTPPQSSGLNKRFVAMTQVLALNRRHMGRRYLGQQMAVVAGHPGPHDRYSLSLAHKPRFGANVTATLIAEQIGV